MCGLAKPIAALKLRKGGQFLQVRLRGGKGKGKAPDDEYSEIEAPKRPLTAYMLFGNAVRQDIVAENPELKMTQVSGVIGGRWKELKPDEKQKFEKQAAALREEYVKSKADYEAKVPEGVRKERILRNKSKGRSAKKKKDPNAPKRAPTPYMVFSNQERGRVKEENPDLSFVDTARKLAEEWNAKDENEKKEYEEKAAVLKEKYLADKAKYDATKEAETESEPEPEPEPKKVKKEKTKETKEKSKKPKEKTKTKAVA